MRSRNRFSMYTATTEQYESVKVVIDVAFKKLRKGGGMITRQNFWCCGSCACAAISQQVAEATAKGKRVADGYVFYHRQCTEDLKERASLYLHYGTTNDDPDKYSADASEKVAARIVAALTEAIAELKLEGHVAVEWDGKASTCVHLYSIDAENDRAARKAEAERRQQEREAERAKREAEREAERQRKADEAAAAQAAYERKPAWQKRLITNC